MTSKKQIQVIVGIGVLVNKQGQVLITQRYDPSHPKAHLKWQLPGGGVEFGETVQEAVIREMKEEVSVEVTIADYLPLVESSLWEHPDKLLQCILVGYICHAEGQTVKIGCEETSDYKWIHPDDIDQYDCLPLAREFVEYVHGYRAQK